MATDRERSRAFNAERRRQLARMNAASSSALAGVKKILAEGQARIQAELAGTPSEFQGWQLPRIQASIEQAMQEVGERLASAGADHTAKAHRLGVDLVDEPIAAGGLRIVGLLPDVDQRQLLAIRSFLTRKLRDVTAEVANRVKTQIGLAMIGAQAPGEAVTGISSLVAGGRGRATTILRTEMGRAFSVATQERQAQASEILPQLKKQWRRSGKIHSRQSHDLADGQIVDVDKPFLVGSVELMYPRDPSAPASETINCGCTSLPYMASWDVRQPGRQPFSADEIRLSRSKRDLADALEG